MESVELARRIRLDAVEMTGHANASHIGSILSVADIIAVLYAKVAHVDPNNPTAPERDRIVLSKGHAGAAVYAALAETGFFPKEWLLSYCDDGSRLSGHVSERGVPGVEFSTGSLGHGASVACGMALAAKIKSSSYHVYVVLGDGECDEGQVWEMALFAAQQRLDNFTVIVDRNGMQAMGCCSDVIDLGDLARKWRDFGWLAVEVADGNDHVQLAEAFGIREAGMPRCIIANTVKGSGVPFMEGRLEWHYRSPQGVDYDCAVRELGKEAPNA